MFDLASQAIVRKHGCSVSSLSTIGLSFGCAALAESHDCWNTKQLSISDVGTILNSAELITLNICVHPVTYQWILVSAKTFCLQADQMPTRCGDCADYSVAEG